MSDKPTTGKAASTQSKPQPQIKSGPEPHIVFRDQMSVRLDRFKLQVANMKKNTSWDRKRPQLVDMEHAHFFLSKNEAGQPQEYCSPIGGHFHKLLSMKVEPVKTGMIVDDENGNQIEEVKNLLVARFGPALRNEYIKRSDGTMKKVIRPVSFNILVETEDGEEQRKLEDAHTHEAVYLHSEAFDPQKKKASQSANAAAHGQTPPKQSVAATGQVPAGFDLAGSKLA